MPAARGKGTSTPLSSPLSCPAAPRLDLFFVSFDLARSRHLVDQAGNEEGKALLLLAHEHLVADLIALCGKFRFRGLLLFEHRKNHSIGATVDRPADLARLHGES